MDFPNGRDISCPVAKDLENTKDILVDIADETRGVRAELKMLRESLVKSATDPDRVNMSFVRESSRRGDWVIGGLLLYCILMTVWFTGVKPQIEKKSGDSSFSAGFTANSNNGENRLQPNQ